MVSGGTTVPITPTLGLSICWNGPVPAALSRVEATVTVGWNGELPPGKMLSTIRFSCVNRPAPPRITDVGPSWYAKPKRGCNSFEGFTKPFLCRGAKRLEQGSPSQKSRTAPG